MANHSASDSRPDLDETINVADAHAALKDDGAAVVREKRLRENGMEPIPLWLILVCGLVVLVGGAVIGQARFLGYNDLVKPGYLRGANPSGEEEDLPPIDIMTAFMKEGAKHYSKCGGCHQPNGQGGNGIPPLAGSEWVTGNTQQLAMIILHGLKGPINVAGVTYNSNMPAMGDGLGAKELAALMTYIRNDWGNSGSLVTPEMAQAALDIAQAGQVDVPLLQAKHDKMLPGEDLSPDTLLDPETFEVLDSQPEK